MIKLRQAIETDSIQKWFWPGGERQNTGRGTLWDIRHRTDIHRHHPTCGHSAEWGSGVGWQGSISFKGTLTLFLFFCLICDYWIYPFNITLDFIFSHLILLYSWYLLYPPTIPNSCQLCNSFLISSFTNACGKYEPLSKVHILKTVFPILWPRKSMNENNTANHN